MFQWQSGEYHLPIPMVDFVHSSGSGTTTGNVLTDGRNLAGHTLTVFAVNGSPANVGQPIVGAYGTLTLNSNGSYTYSLNSEVRRREGFIDQFSYTVTDGGSGIASAIIEIGRNFK